jgi:DGQHR domain-containing protein
MEELNLKVIKGPNFKDVLSQENDVPYFIGYISAKDLVNHYKIPYSSETGKLVKGDTGYQRPPGMARIGSFAKKIVNSKVDFPTVVLLNVRDNKLLNHVKGNSLSYMPEIHNKLYVMDGQHRVLALKTAMKKAMDDDDQKTLDMINEIQIPFGLTITESVLNEMVIFYEVNSNAKGVPANVKDQINARRVAEGDSELLKQMELTGDDWKIIANKILEDVSVDYDSVWFKRIKFPNVEVRSPNVGNFAMTKYLNRIINSNETKMVSDKLQFSKQVFNAYWEGFRMAWPKAFDENASKYSIQTAMGADVFMRLWPFMKDWIVRNQSSNSQNLREPKTYIEPFKKVITNSTGEDPSGNIQNGLDYWLKGSSAGAQGAGEAGKSSLAGKLEMWLSADE